jgi:hypothetical protein
MLDRVITGIGRIQRASGTNSVTEHAEINGMITALRRRMDQPDSPPINRAALVALYAGEVTGLQLLRAYHRDRLADVVPLDIAVKPATVAEARAAESLETAWNDWNAKTVNNDTRANRRYALKRLTEVAPEGKAKVADLPSLMLLLADRYAGQSPAFNRVRASVLRFLRTRLTKVHPLYLAVVAMDAMEETPTQRKAPSLARAIAIRGALDPKPAAIWWSMYTTGMNPKEYDGEWERDGDAVHILGTKRDARFRWVPCLGEVVRRTMGWSQYREALAALPKEVRGTEGVQRNDARRGYRALLESAKLGEPRIRLYMGHKLDVSQNYGRPESLTAVAEDRPTILAVVEAGEEAARAGRKRTMRTG